MASWVRPEDSSETQGLTVRISPESPPIPSVSTPSVSTRSLPMPGVSMPGVSVPGVSMPGVAMQGVSMSGVSIPASTEPIQIPPSSVNQFPSPTYPTTLPPMSPYNRGSFVPTSPTVSRPLHTDSEQVHRPSSLYYGGNPVYVPSIPSSVSSPPARVAVNKDGPTEFPGESLLRDSSTDPSSSPDGDFEEMVTDIRRVFGGWLRKHEMEMRKTQAQLQQAREEFEQEKKRLRNQIQEEKQIEVTKMKEERRKLQVEITASRKQIQAEREEERHRIQEERLRFENNCTHTKRNLLMERERQRQEFEAFEAERKRIVDSSIATESMVELNVGGVLFETSRHTLVQQEGSFLAGMLSGRHIVSRDRNGRLFLDRDSELFRTILGFLRSPETPPIPRDTVESDAICKEAEFYGIHFFPFPLVFVCGGHDGVEHLRAMEMLDVGQQCWRPSASIETPRAYFGSAVLHNRLYVYGGQNLDYKALCDMETYDVLRDMWMPGPGLNVPRRNTCGVNLDQRLFTIGGFDGSNILAAVEAYDPRMKNWMNLTSMTNPRSSAMCCIKGGKIYTLGGTKGERLRSVEVYDPRMNTWELLPVAMIEVRSAGNACCTLNQVYALGGTDANNTIHSSIETLDANDQRWSYCKDMSVPRMDAACTVISDCIMVGGGQNGDVLSTVEFYRPEADEWKPGPTMLFPRYGHSFLLANL